MDMTLYLRRGPTTLRKKRKFGKLLLLLIVAAGLMVLFPFRNIIYPEIYFDMNTSSQRSKEMAFAPFVSPSNYHQASEKRQHKCGLPKSCPIGTFAFNIRSGAANAIPPKICFNGQIILSSSLKNADDGLNIAVINARTGELIRTGTFNMWHGEVESLIQFLKAVEKDTLVLIATYDDGATKITDEARGLIAELGSASINKLKFRDNWVFAGGKGISGRSPFEKHIANNRTNNKYDNWPELLEMTGCFPQKMD
ncbi:protein FAM3C [Sardina pilchardus]|uniref:protein FAM3C n=1 Tax=Sardina pilchardus TaxID=27697 RepID=UPI002E117E7F